MFKIAATITLAITIFFVLKNIFILHQNINGLVNKADLFTVHLNELLDSGKHVDIICITEHNMKTGDETQLAIPNYKLASHFSRDNRNGGSCILIKNIYRFKILYDIVNLSIRNVLECSAIDLTDFDIVIICIYRVPKNDSTSMTIFFNRLELILAKMCTKGRKIIVCGDYNIDILKRTRFSIEFQNLLASYNLRLGVTEATRLHSNTCIDNIIYNVRGGRTEVLDLAISDHTAQIMNCPVKKACLLSHWYVKRRDMCMENIIKFNECLQNLSFNCVYMSNNANEAYNNFLDLFKLFYDLCFPLIRSKITATKKTKWVSSGIKKCCIKKRALLWKYRLCPNENTKRLFKQYSKRLRKIILLTQKSQNDYYIKQSANKSKATWNIVNNAKTVQPKENITRIRHHGKLITDPELIAQEFNNHFIDQAKLITNANNFNNLQLYSTLTYDSTHSLFMQPTSPNDIQNIIYSLKNSNSTGYDGICTKVIKKVALSIASPISYIINLCILQGIFPEKLKVAIVRPFFKKGDKENMDNYRPIALLPIFSKIFEKVICNSVSKYFESNNLLAQEQKGFRKNKSINMAIFDLLQVIMNNMDKKRPICALYMDLTKAFDLVDHNILMKKLYKYGIRGNIYDLLMSYLVGRKQVVQINHISLKMGREVTLSSDFGEISHGVPQGSVLGPLLFLIYINDLPKAIDHPIVLFADDSTVVLTGDDPLTCKVNINNALESIINWLNLNNLCINLEKTKIMNFYQRNNSMGNISVTYNNHIIEETDNTKFLGLSLDNKLTWKSQVDTICNKLNRFSYALYNLSKKVSRAAVLTAYHAYVTSTLRYGIMFWGNSTDRELVFKAQKKCLRSVCSLKPTESCKSYFIELKILTFPCLYIFEMAMYVKSNLNQFSVFNSVRQRHKIGNNQSKTALRAKSAFGMAPKVYNKLPDFIRQSDMQEFKKKLLHFLTYNAFYSVNEYLDYKPDIY